MRSSSALVPPGKPRKVFQKSPMALGNLGGRAEGIDVGHSKCHFSAIKILLELIAWNNSGGGILCYKPSFLMVLEKRGKNRLPNRKSKVCRKAARLFSFGMEVVAEGEEKWSSTSRNAIPRNTKKG